MDTIEQVLVPMDGSPLSKQALRIALDEYPDAKVTVLHVLNPAQPGYSYPMEYDTETEPLHGSEEWYERAEEVEDQLFEEAREIATEFDSDIETITREGEPGREIIEYVNQNGIDQVIIGSHGRSEDEQFFLGSVTEMVVFRSPVRVLLVR
ncbi:MAG: universal stress protein [Halobacteriales archaeon]|nr:universal stress protein [Halobacteriales archaeon]